MNRLPDAPRTRAFLGALLHFKGVAREFAPHLDPDAFPRPAQRDLARLALADMRALREPAERDWRAFLARNREGATSAGTRATSAAALEELQAIEDCGAAYNPDEWRELLTASPLAPSVALRGASKEAIRRAHPSLYEAGREHGDVIARTADLVKTWNAMEVRAYADQVAATKSPHTITKARLALYALRCRLIALGNAPRWHGVAKPLRSDLAALVEADAMYVDLAHLTTHWPTHKPSIAAWQIAWERPGNLEAAHRIVKRRQGRHYKVRALALTTDQQAGCVHLCTKQTETELDNAERTLQRAERTQRDGAEERGKANRLSEADIANRITLHFAATLAGWTPEGTARNYQAMTGKRISRQAAAKHIKGLKMGRKKRAFSCVLLPCIVRPGVS